MHAKFRHAWAPVIASILAAAASISGCGGPPIPEMPKPVFTSATSPHGPVRYPFTAFPTCEEIGQRIPELAPSSRPSRVDSPGQLSQECEYRDPEDADGVPVVYLRIRLYNNVQDLSGFSSGAEVAKQLFDAERPPDAERDTGVGIGTEVLWAEPDAAGNCGLGILDENAVLRLWYRPGTAAKVDPRSAQCREPARAIARKLHSAVQPR
ncbi:hypothetical protein JOF53_000495 [Crossiella equi]|uniref:DUF3558 domain-containing protein n=1 Tax=Crossiella equi TaxID=130796 RepID=A0ABS5A4W0_9PSEU|nr:hypothetical protein [Crossiella equi]MBP2471623.1 hypothetical protein [Crossiella equi]